MKHTLLSSLFAVGTLFAASPSLAGKPSSYQALPGRIEAESYTAMYGIQTESTSDTGGGLNVSWIDDNDWLDYDVHVSSAGTYIMRFRTAETYGNGIIEIRNASGAVLGTVSVPQTGGWQSWTTISTPVTLPAGDQTLRLFVKSGAWNFNWFDVVSPRALSGKIEAEDYDGMKGIQVDPTSDTGGGYNVGWIDDGDWLDYSVRVDTAGSYNFLFRIANAYADGKIEVRSAATDSVLGRVDVPITGGWQNWSTITTTVPLSAGIQVLRVYVKQGGWNFNWFEANRSSLQASVINFGPLPDKTVGDAPFDLTATSTNNETPVTFSSSNTSVVTVSNATGTWKATVLAAGTVTLTASQAGNSHFAPAQSVGVALTVLPADTAMGTKIPVTASRWYQLNNVSNGLEGLFDGNLSASVSTGYGKILPHFDAYYPLEKGENMTIQGIRFYDGEGSLGDYPLTISIIDAQWNRKTIATFSGSRYNEWVGPYPDRVSVFRLDTAITNARYIVLSAWYQYPNEVEFYGTYTPPATSPGALPAKHAKLKDMMGVNAFEWDFEDPNDPSHVQESKLAPARAFSGIRHYMDWEKLESNEGRYTYNPVHSGSWNYDAIYQRCKEVGMTVLACLKTIPGWMQQTYPEGQRDAENVPLKYGKDFSDPQSYLEQAKVAFQYAARYGANTNVNPALLSVDTTIRWTGDPVNTVKIGLNLIKYIECDNERDKWWKGRRAYQTGREYAANMSAFYDGHKNTMGPGVGVKNADPTMIVVMGGLASASTDYIRGMIDWCKEFRGYKPDSSVNLCWDVINYHFYSDNTSSSQSGTSGRGAAPEIAPTYQRAIEFRELAHAKAYDMPVWVTEAGYDLNQGSPLKAIAIGTKTVEQVQADWLLRTALTYARGGIDKLFFYQLYDDNPTVPIQFGSMGFINTNLTRRLSADYLKQTTHHFGEYAWQETLHADPIVDRYSYNGKSAYMLVVPDEVGRTASYSLDLDGAGAALRYTLRAGADSMRVDTLTAVSGHVSVPVSETPVFIVPMAATGGRTASAEKPADLSLLTLRVYPNPSAKDLKISLENDRVGPVKVSVYDANLGRIHRRSTFRKETTLLREKIDLSGLPKGLYVVEVLQDDVRMFKKIVKEEE